MNIVLLEPLAVGNQVIDKLSEVLTAKGHSFTSYNTIEKDIEAQKERVKDADILIIANSPLKGEVIKAAERLKYIAVAFTGVDHVDREACTEKGVIVSNSAGYSTDSVAEATLGMIISLLRNLVPCNNVVRKEGTKDGLVGFELRGKTVGIVGTGSIGLRVAELLKVFNCKLLGFSRSEKEEGKELGIEYVTLEELLSRSDIVTLHTPLNENTKGLINKDRIALMKESSILINAARGPVVDSEALAQALNSGRIAGAGIDVYEVEPPVPSSHPLFNAKNTICTPHIAFATKESMVKRAEIVFDNVYSYLDGKLKNQVF